MIALNLYGKVFGKLTVIERVGSIKKQSAWKCLCKCGKTRISIGSELNRGAVLSCGCENRTKETTKKYRAHPLYDVWKGMKARCRDKKHKAYSNYGGVGVAVCELWGKDFFSFYNWSLENGWERGLQIDKDIKAKEMGVEPLLYSPERCQYITPAVNCQNKTTNKLTREMADEIRVSTMRIVDLSKKYNINQTTVQKIKRNKIWK